MMYQHNGMSPSLHPDMYGEYSLGTLQLSNIMHEIGQLRGSRDRYIFSMRRTTSSAPIDKMFGTASVYSCIIEYTMVLSQF